MKESDIRPVNLLNEYLRLSALDAEAYFNSSERQAISCPACDGTGIRAFAKHGFDYQECGECGSLYQSPRPLLREFERFYGDSPSSNYWAETFFPSVAEARREKIFKPRAERIKEMCGAIGFVPGVVIDVGAGYGIFLEEWSKISPGSHLRAVEPGCKLARTCRVKGIEVLECLAEQAEPWHSSGDLITCFEVIEHAYSPLDFIRALHALIRPGGWVVISGLGVEGYDIQVLWERSKSISPPHHINFLSVAGFETLFQRAGFREVRVSTPGNLDVDIVFNSLKERNGLGGIRRFENILMKRGKQAADDFQNFLVQHRMSSHTWVMAKKPGNLGT